MHIGDGKTAGVSVGCGLWAYLYTSSVKEFYFFTVLRSPNEKAEKPVISLSIHYHGVCPESKIFWRFCLVGKCPLNSSVLVFTFTFIWMSLGHVFLSKWKTPISLLENPLTFVSMKFVLIRLVRRRMIGWLACFTGMLPCCTLKIITLLKIWFKKNVKFRITLLRIKIDILMLLGTENLSNAPTRIQAYPTWTMSIR